MIARLENTIRTIRYKLSKWTMDKRDYDVIEQLREYHSKIVSNPELGYQFLNDLTNPKVRIVMNQRRMSPELEESMVH